MRKLKLLLFLITLAAIIAPDIHPDSAGGKITMEFDLSRYEKEKEVKLWIPYPVSDKNQAISNVVVKGNYSESAVYIEKKFRTSILYARWEAGKEKRKLTFSFRVKRKELTRRDLADSRSPVDTNEKALYLSPTKLGPFNKQVRDLSLKITGNKKTVLQKVKAVYDWTTSNMYRDPNTRGCGTGNVCSLLVKRGGKCTDISSVFVTLLRASGVPAREIFGIRLGKKPEQNITTWYHCWAEFFLPGQGWIPADPADVRKLMLVKNIKYGSRDFYRYYKYYWGGIDQYRVQLGIGRDLHLNPAQEGAPINYLMYPFAQAGGKTIDWLDPQNFKYRITYSKH